MRSSIRAANLALTIMLAISLAGCAGGETASDLPQAESVDVAESLLDYWLAHGGEQTFGPPIQHAQASGNILRQTFACVELIYNALAPPATAVHLEPLGWQLGLAHPAEPLTEEAGERYFPATGHTLDAEFAETYEWLGGEPVAGAPISPLIREGAWVVQYFENIGLYRPASGLQSEVHLLAFGLAAHPEALDLRPELSSYLLPPGLRMRPFARFLDQIGGEALLGPPLTEPFVAADGFLEQVYERAALFAPTYDLSQVRLRPLGEGQGAPAAPVAADPLGLHFPETGHNLGAVFKPFYLANEGESLLGPPLEEAHDESGHLVQRFQNAVLEWRQDLPSHLALQFAPLGAAYLAGIPPEILTPAFEAMDLVPLGSEQELTVTIETRVEHPLLPVGEAQRIDIRVSLSNGKAWAGITPLLVVHAPGGDQYPPVPATDATGSTSVLVELENLLPGEIVNYEIVVTGSFGMGYALGQFTARAGR